MTTNGARCMEMSDTGPCFSLMRDRYETQSDVENQQRVLYIVLPRIPRAYWFEKMPDEDHIDYIIKDYSGNPLRVLEVKCRTNERLKYPDYMIALHKWQACLDAAYDYGCPALLAVQWTDSLGIISSKFITEPDRIATGGRCDRDDPLDVEECAYFNINRFVLID